LFEVIDLEVSSVGEVDKGLPVGHQSVNLLLNLGFDLVVVHIQNSELLLHFNNLELHIHRNILDLTDNLQQTLEQVEGAHLSVQVFVVLVRLFNDLSQLFACNSFKRVSQDGKPLVDLLNSLEMQVRIIDQNNIVVLLFLSLQVVLENILDENDSLLDFFG
jgi:hypothetical protein